MGCELCLGNVNRASPVAGVWSRGQRQELEVNAKDVLQPLKKDGTINKNFVSVYGTKMLEKEYKTTKEKVLKEVERYG